MAMEQNTKKSGGSDIESIYPLSHTQQGMLFQSLANPEARPYFARFQYLISGGLDIAAFGQAWQQAIARHPALRSQFLWNKRKQPLQVVRKQMPLPWQVFDWRTLPTGEREARTQAFLQADHEQYFQLDKAPLTRFCLIRETDDACQFIWSSHHILGDGWSMAVVLQELWALYAAIVQGRPANLKTPRPYRDYIAWLRQQDAARAEAFWRENLKGFSVPTPLVVDKPQSESQRHAQHVLRLPAELSATLKSFAQTHRMTLATLAQAAWALLLHRYSGEQDVLFGVTVSGRPADLPGIESMVGLFVNTLPARVKIDGQASCLDWLRTLHAQHIERDGYAYSALMDIQGWSEVPNGTALFDSFIVVQNLPIDEALRQIPGGLALSEAPGSNDEGHAGYPLTLIVSPGERMAVQLIYAEGRFESGAVARMAGHFQTLLEGIAAEPGRALDDMPLLTAQERRQLLAEWNATTTAKPLDVCVHHLVEEQARKAPEAVALAYAGQTLTFSELDRRANRLARHLQALGAGPDVPVGFCLERGLDAGVAILGILKAGSACLPLDPEYPPQRLAAILADARPAVLLTRTGILSRLAADFPLALVLLDLDGDAIAQQSADAPESAAQTGHLAYVIYTSGSTGSPKGIGVPHRSITNTVEYHQMELPEAVNWLQFASFNFDVSYHEIFAAWCLGGTVFMMPEEARLNPSMLTGLLADNPIHKMILPVTLLQQLTEMYAVQPQLFRNLRGIAAAGEQLQITGPIKDLFKRLGHCALYNFYGPTEANFVSAYRFGAQTGEWPSYPPIGKPSPNVRVYILDSCLRPVPIGVIGEIHVGGAGLARGYFNRPEQTLEKFIADPFGGGAEAKLYKTGDLARYLPDGNIEFLGRLDDTVKIRGNRVDLGEVESVVNQHPAIAQAVVSVYGHSGADKLLAAYFVPAQGTIAAPDELRQYLRQRLPDYMIPSAFVALDAFPLSPNGKVDRRALPVPDMGRSGLAQDYVAPRNATEEVLASLWGEVLGVGEVGIHDNFFDLGGHSLRAIQIVSQILQTFDLEVSVRHVFKHPTVAQLAVAMAEEAGGLATLDEIAETVQAIAGLTPEQIQAMIAAEA